MKKPRAIALAAQRMSEKCAPADGTNAAVEKRGFDTSSGCSNNKLPQRCIDAEGV
jgi:hypothetical protein